MKVFEVGDVVDEKYEILSVLGQGGMGSVFSARHCELDSIRALKIPDPSILDDELGRKMFVREAQAVERLSHPNITRIYDVVNKTDLIYIAMELIEGTEINKYLHKNQDRMTLHDLLNIIEQITQALDFAHQQGVIHRDIKPNNIMVCKEDNRVKILDYGIARISGKTMADFTLRSAGTPRYMAPEQFKGKESLPQTDLYSLAVIIYQLFTGKPVFEADTSDALGFMCVHEMPAPIMTHNPNLPHSLNDVLMKALAKEPGHRYATGANFYQALRSSLAGSEDLSIKEFLNSGPSRTVLPGMMADGGTTEKFGMGGGPTGTMLTPGTLHSQTTDAASRGTKPTVVELVARKKLMPLLAAALILIILGGGYLLMTLGNGGSTAQNIAQVATPPAAAGAKPVSTAITGNQTQTPRQTDTAVQTPAISDSGQTADAQPDPSAPDTAVVKPQDPRVKMIAELKKVTLRLTNIKADQQRIENAVTAYERALSDAERETALTEIEALYGNLAAIEEKNRTVGEINQQREQKIALAGKLKTEGWVESTEGLVESDWTPSALSMLQEKPFEPGQEQFQNMAIGDIAALDEKYKELNKEAEREKTEKFASTKMKVESLESDLQKLINEAKSLAAARELKPHEEQAVQLNEELKPIQRRYMTMDADEYTKKDYQQDQASIGELSSRFSKIREALYQKPIIVRDVQVTDDFGYDFGDEQSAFNELFLDKNNYVVIQAQVEHDAIYNVTVALKAEKKNERASFGDMKLYDFMHSYDVKVFNGGTMLAQKTGNLKWSGTPSQLNDAEYKQKVGEFRSKFRGDLLAVSQEINAGFVEVKKKAAQ